MSVQEHIRQLQRTEWDAQLASVRDTIESRSYEREGLKLRVTISPCCWMYPSYGFQFQYSDEAANREESRSWGYIRDRLLSWENATPADVERMLTSCPVEPCEKCGEPHLFNKDSNRLHQCERCFLNEIDARLKKSMEREARKQATRDEKMIAQGFTHRIDAWVHPRRGDDYRLEMYSKGEMPRDEIKGHLRRAGSMTLTDYSIIQIAEQ